MRLASIALTAAVVAAGLVAPATPAAAVDPATPTAIGYGGAVSTVDATATAVGLDVLRQGGNAVDAAVAAAATLGVTEPFSSGIGGGGFFVYYDAHTELVHTIDGREAAPASMGQNAFVDPVTGPYQFQEARVSGISAGVPGTPLTW
ncbi:MAG TPA: gamma-glutamyltransferase, partial [Asanoa sp.]